jgi:hypothetical protein
MGKYGITPMYGEVKWERFVDLTNYDKASSVKVNRARKRQNFIGFPKYWSWGYSALI